MKKYEFYKEVVEEVKVVLKANDKIENEHEAVEHIKKHFRNQLLFDENGVVEVNFISRTRPHVQFILDYRNSSGSIFVYHLGYLAGKIEWLCAEDIGKILAEEFFIKHIQPIGR